MDITNQSTPGARFVDPKVLARIGSLNLLARTVVDGFINGLHKAPYLGMSVDFAEGLYVYRGILHNITYFLLAIDFYEKVCDNTPP